MKPIIIGIMPQEEIRERIYAIARGEYKPKPTEPKVWFTSMKSLAEVLSYRNYLRVPALGTAPRISKELAMQIIPCCKRPTRYIINIYLMRSQP